MKKLLIPFLVITIALFQSCTGPAGRDGVDAQNIVGTTFEITGVNFNAGNKYLASFTFPPNEVEVFESDAILVYREWGVENTASVWRLLPQTYIMSNNLLLQYNFDHTFKEAFFYLDGNVNKATLDPTWTQNQTFRVVIVPSAYTSRKDASVNVDYNDYNSVVKYLGIDESKIKTYHINNH